MDTKRFILVCGVGAGAVTATVLLKRTVQKLVKTILSE